MANSPIRLKRQTTSENEYTAFRERIRQNSGIIEERKVFPSGTKGFMVLDDVLVHLDNEAMKNVGLWEESHKPTKTTITAESLWNGLNQLCEAFDEENKKYQHLGLSWKSDAGEVF